MLRKLFKSLRKRSKTAPKPEQAEESREQAEESREQKVRRLVAQKELDNFWNYDGTEQPPIDEATLMEMSQ